MGGLGQGRTVCWHGLKTKKVRSDFGNAEGLVGGTVALALALVVVTVVVGVGVGKRGNEALLAMVGLLW